MSIQSQEFSRGESRYRAGELGRARVLVERPEAPEAGPLAAAMVDLSAGGVRLALEVPLKFSEIVRLRFEHDRAPLNLSMTATVRWIRSSPDDRWTAGCSFSPLLPAECMHELFEQGLLERRRSRRHPVRGSLLAHWELSPAPAPAELVDLSTGGFAIRCAGAVSPGGRINVSYTRPDGTQPSCEAKAQWCLQTGEAFVVGCEFVTSAGFPLLQEVAERPTEVAPVPPARPRRGLPVEAWLGLAIAAAGATAWWLSR